MQIGADESDLVVRAQSGDQRAFEILYTRYNNKIFRYVSRMVGSDSIGCELTYDTFSRAWEGLQQLRDPERFTSWLYTIARHCVYTYQDRMKRRRWIPWVDNESDGTMLSVSGPEAQFEESELVRLALARVSKRYRPFVILYFMEDIPQRQIANILGVKESIVSKYVCRGKEELRRIYQRLNREAGGALGGKEQDA